MRRAVFGCYLIMVVGPICHLGRSVARRRVLDAVFPRPNWPAGATADALLVGDMDTSADGHSGVIPLRTILRARVIELGPVAFPVYPQTSVRREGDPSGPRAIAEEYVSNRNGSQ